MDVIIVLGCVFIFLSYFLIGSWPVGRTIGKFFANVEVQEAGSGKDGATNVMRVTGDRMLGVVVFMVDAGAKGTLWMFAVYWIFGVIFHTYSWIVYACFAAVLLGHIFPVLTFFKTGGAGIALLIGGLMSIVPGLAYALAVIVWLIVFNVSKGVKFLCNIAAVVSLMMVGLIFNFSWAFAGFTVFATALTMFAHQRNFNRWRRGQEEKKTWDDLWKSILKLGEIFKKSTK